MKNFLRNYATPLGLVTFAALGTTGLMMFVGVRNHELGELHEKFGLLFVVVAILHLVRNGPAFVHMLGATRSKLVVGVLGAVAVLLIGTVLLTSGPGAPDTHDPAHADPVAQHLSYAPINQLAPAFGLSSSQVITRLRKGGVAVTGPGQNLADISQKTGADVGHLLALIVNDPSSADTD